MNQQLKLNIFKINQKYNIIQKLSCFKIVDFYL